LISISHYLYRKSVKWATAVLLAITLPSSLVNAQLRDRTEHQKVDQSQQKPAKKDKRGPRAIAVVEFLPGGGTRLVPIALWIDGHFYDASLYGANPEPMALQPETLYQALTYGEPAGWFTVTTPRDVKGNWVADGQWKPETPVEAKMAQQAAKQQPKPKPKGQDVLSDDQGPPVLRRPGDTATPGGGQSGAPASTSGGNSTPSGGGNSTANSNTPSKSNDDPDRPTLKASPPSSASAPANSKPTLGDNTQQEKAQAPATNASAGVSPDENDPNRPILRRGKPTAQAVVTDTDDPDAPASKATKPVAGGGATAAPAISTKVTQAPRAYAAISDAGNYETRSLLYGMATGERERMGDPMSKMAMDDVRKYASQHNGPAPPKTATITDYDLRGFDLDYSNSPTLVLTAKLPVAPTKPIAGFEFDYFVTVVARVDLNGTPQKIFSVVSDTNHLDAYPRMQVIDAIDADANGRGDLLFRQYSDTGISYALYRVFPYQMTKIFEGGSGM
jgi:hypothetical protein